MSYSYYPSPSSAMAIPQQQQLGGIPESRSVGSLLDMSSLTSAPSSDHHQIPTSSSINLDTLMSPSSGSAYLSSAVTLNNQQQQQQQHQQQQQQQQHQQSADDIQRKFLELQEQQQYIKRLQEQQKDRLKLLEQPQHQQQQQQQQFVHQQPSTTSTGVTSPTVSSLSSVASPSIMTSSISTAPSAPPSTPTTTATTATSASSTATGQTAQAASQQLQFMRWVQEHLEKMNKFMVDVERKVDTLEGRVQEVLALQRIQQGEKQEILQALNTLRSDISSIRVAPQSLAAAPSSNTAATTSTAAAAIVSPSYTSPASSSSFQNHGLQVESDAEIAKRIQAELDAEERRQAESRPTESRPIDIGSVVNSAPASEPCPICRKTLTTQHELQLHVQSHFDDAPAGGSGSNNNNNNAAAANTAAAYGMQYQHQPLSLASQPGATSPEPGTSADDKQNAPWWKRIFGAQDGSATATSPTAANAANKDASVPQPPVFSYTPAQVATASSKLPANAQLVTQRGTPVYYPSTVTASQLPARTSTYVADPTYGLPQGYSYYPGQMTPQQQQQYQYFVQQQQQQQQQQLQQQMLQQQLLLQQQQQQQQHHQQQ